MKGIAGSKLAAANISRSLVWISKPARSIAAPVSRAGWQPPAILGHGPLWSAAWRRSRLGWQFRMTCS
jgi:hypothetical protein